MAEMKIYGRVSDIYSPRTGVTRDGNPWSLQDIIVTEPDDKFPVTIALTIDNYRTSSDESQLFVDSLQTGKLITLSCSVSSKQYTTKDGRTGYATNVKCFRVEEGDTRNAVKRTATRNAEPCVVSVGTPTREAPAQVTAPQTDDQLPF